jgi:hypothetical protein
LDGGIWPATLLLRGILNETTVALHDLPRINRTGRCHRRQKVRRESSGRLGQDDAQQETLDDVDPNCPVHCDTPTKTDHHAETDNDTNRYAETDDGADRHPEADGDTTAHGSSDAKTDKHSNANSHSGSDPGTNASPDDRTNTHDRDPKPDTGITSAHGHRTAGSDDRRCHDLG